MAEVEDDSAPPHVSIEFVGGPLCGLVIDSRVHRLRTRVVRRLAIAARNDRPGVVRVAVTREPSAEVERLRDHRYRLEVEFGFAGRVLFRAVYIGVAEGCLRQKHEATSS